MLNIFPMKDMKEEKEEEEENQLVTTVMSYDHRFINARPVQHHVRKNLQRGLVT